MPHSVAATLLMRRDLADAHCGIACLIFVYAICCSSFPSVVNHEVTQELVLARLIVCGAGIFDLTRQEQTQGQGHYPGFLSQGYVITLGW